MSKQKFVSGLHTAQLQKAQKAAVICVKMTRLSIISILINKESLKFLDFLSEISTLKNSAYIVLYSKSNSKKNIFYLAKKDKIAPIQTSCFAILGIKPD